MFNPNQPRYAGTVMPSERSITCESTNMLMYFQGHGAAIGLLSCPDQELCIFFSNPKLPYNNQTISVQLYHCLQLETTMGYIIMSQVRPHVIDLQPGVVPCTPTVSNSKAPVRKANKCICVRRKLLHQPPRLLCFCSRSTAGQQTAQLVIHAWSFWILVGQSLCFLF